MMKLNNDFCSTQIIKYYGLEPIDLHICDYGGWQSEIVMFKVGEVLYVSKWYKREAIRPGYDIRTVSLVMHTLYQNGCRVPNITAQKDGSYFVKLRKGRWSFIIVYPYILGTPLTERSDKVSYLPKVFASLGNLHSDLHKVSFEGKSFIPSLEISEFSKITMYEIKNRIGSNPLGLDETRQHLLQEWWEKSIQTVKIFRDNSILETEKIITNSDISLLDTLITPENEIAFIDFDLLRAGYPLEEIAALTLHSILEAAETSDEVEMILSNAYSWYEQKASLELREINHPELLRPLTLLYYWERIESLLIVPKDESEKVLLTWLINGFVVNLPRIVPHLVSKDLVL